MLGIAPFNIGNRVEIKEELAIQEALTLVEKAKALKIIDLKSFRLGEETSISLKRVEKGIEKYWEKSVEDAETSYKTQKTLRDNDIKPVQAARKFVDGICGTWKAENDRLERIEQQRLEDEANEKAEKERQKLLEKAVKVEEKNPEKAEELLEKAADVVPAPAFAQKVVAKTTKFEFGGSRTWIPDIIVEVVDIKQACLAVANGHIPMNCVGDFKGLKAWAKMQGKKNEDIYGLSIRETSRPSTRT